MYAKSEKNKYLRNFDEKTLLKWHHFREKAAKNSKIITRKNVVIVTGFL